ncbi:hypothetical protein KP79_PYT04149 [Mizuhopecten yessoensis]|uniref:Uncharacterized protein n=1 Tax=Mizuhopecten yessoensis TaxID=6573 RepID=A0A210Q442_MIZYE|nr:hypothetical protein KP79_PYT04149 [Mizuhopecten yessoensis]
MGINSSAFIRYTPPHLFSNLNCTALRRPLKSRDSIYNYKPANKEAEKYYEAYIKTRSLILQAERMEREAKRMSGKEARELKREANQIRIDAKAMLNNVGKLWDKAENKNVTPETNTLNSGQREKIEKSKRKTKTLKDNSNVLLAPVPKVSEESKKADEIYNRAIAVIEESQHMMWESNLLGGMEARLLREEAKQLKQYAEETMKKMGRYCLAAEEQRRFQIQEQEKDEKDANTKSRTKSKIIKKRKRKSSKDIK